MRHSVGSPARQGWVNLSNTSQTEPRDVLCFVHNNESFTFPMLFFLSVLFYGTFSPSPGCYGADPWLGGPGWCDSGRMLLACSRSLLSCSFIPEVLTETMPWTCQRGPASHLHQILLPSLHLFFLSRDKIAKQSILWVFLSLLVTILLRNLWFGCKIPLKNVCPCSCNPWGLLRTEI